MTKDRSVELQSIFTDADSLKSSMEATMSVSTEDFAKWVTFKHVARSHANLVKRYTDITNEKMPFYDYSKMQGSGDTVWPVMKEIFEGVYIELSSLHARLRERLPSDKPTGFDDLLHPVIRNAAIKHYQNGDYRNASLDAVVALFDHLRSKSGLTGDGEALCNQAFSLGTPVLILSELTSDSGRNDQSGFLDIFKGFYRGVRNPKAHSLLHNLDATKAAQHMVLASMLARRVDEAKVVATGP